MVLSNLIAAYRLRRNDLDATDIEDGAEIISLCEKLEPSTGYRPKYESRSYNWLLNEAAKARSCGELEKEIVTDASGERIGWYVHFVRRMGICDVMQVGGHLEKFERLIGHLMTRARSKGPLPLVGQIDARYASALVSARCNFTFGSSFLVYSQNPEILRAVHAGQSSLSGLDGEWWLHFADGPW